MSTAAGIGTTCVGVLDPQLRKYLEAYTTPYGTYPSLSEEDATTVLQGMQNEVYQVFIGHLCQYYIESWKIYRSDANANGPTSDGRIRELCATILKEVQNCVGKERVSFHSSEGVQRRIIRRSTVAFVSEIDLECVSPRTREVVGYRTRTRCGFALDASH